MKTHSRPPAWFATYSPEGDPKLRAQLLARGDSLRAWGPLWDNDVLPAGLAARRRCIRCREALGQLIAFSMVVPERTLPHCGADGDEPVLAVFWLCAELCLQRKSLRQEVLRGLAKARHLLPE